MADETSNSDDPAANAGGDIPEVEAEIVEKGDAPAQEGAFTDHKADADAENKPAPKRIPFTPGVILFFGFAGLAIAVFVLWRLQGSEKMPVADTSQTQEEVAPPDSDEGNQAEALAEGEDKKTSTARNSSETLADNKTDAGGNQSADEAASVDPDKISGKIENTAPEEIKSAARDVLTDNNPAAVDDVYLPPLGSDKMAPGGNQALQQAAKDAFRAIQSETESTPPENDDQPAVPQTDDAPAFDIAPDAMDIAMQSQSDSSQPTSSIAGTQAQPDANDEGLATATDQAPPAITAPVDNTKVLNQMAALKESFEAEKAKLTQALNDERQRNQEQGTEIEALRRDFQAALDARDDEANAENEKLRERIAKIRNDEIAPVARRVAGAVALRALESAFDQGAPFATELRQLEQAAPGAPAIMVLNKYAQTGVATLSALKDRFGPAARAALAAAGKDKAGGFWGALRAQAQSIISVRPAGPQAGNSAQAIISRAEDAVENNDISGALTELTLLSSASLDEMAPWIEDASARIAAAAAIQEINNSILGAL